MTRLQATVAALLIGCGAPSRSESSPPAAQPVPSTNPAPTTHAAPEWTPSGQKAEVVFAGGCFWCMESSFEEHAGVYDAVSGYAGGSEQEPTYRQVGSGATGHAEVIKVVYDPTVLDYDELLDLFWHNIDPTQANGQFCDRGPQYRSAIFVSDDAQKTAAERTKAAVAAELGEAVVTEIVPSGPFWPAEDYHQDFYKKNPDHYQRYRTGCGRDRRLRELWGDKTGGH